MGKLIITSLIKNFNYFKFSDKDVMKNFDVDTVNYFKWFFIFGYTFKSKIFSSFGFNTGLENIAFSKGLLEQKISLSKAICYDFNYNYKDITKINYDKASLFVDFFDFNNIKNNSVMPIKFNLDLVLIKFDNEAPFQIIKVLNTFYKLLSNEGWLIIINANSQNIKTGLHTFLIKNGNDFINLDSLNGIYLIKK